MRTQCIGGAPTLGRHPVNARQSDSVSRDDMEFRILGPLEVLDGGGTADARRSQAARAARPAAAGRQPDRLRRAARRRPVGRGRARSRRSRWSTSTSRGCARRCPRARCRRARPATRSRSTPSALDLGASSACARRAARRSTRATPATAAARLREALALWRGPALAEFSEPFARVEAAASRGAPARLPRGPDRRRPRARAPRRRGRRARGARRPPPAARAPARPAHARALPLRPPGRGARRLPRLPRRARRASSGSSRRRACASSRAGSCARTPRSTAPRRDVDPAAAADRTRSATCRAVGGYSIAYQVVGEGPLDLVLRARLGVLVPGRLGAAGARALLPPPGVAGPADPVRQARHRALGPRPRRRRRSRSGWTTCAR